MERVPTGDSGVHYDNHPVVFERMLDRNMNYSSGYYLTGEEDLDTGQLNKMNKIAAICGFQSGDKILDMGCGWSGPALYFADTFGCDVTGLTLSEVQRDFAMERARLRGCEQRLHICVENVLDADFAPGTFDHIIFLESIIHMWEKADIFAFCNRVLKPGGTVFIQESCYDKNSLTEQYRTDRGFNAVDEAFGYTTTMVSVGEMQRLMEEADLLPVFVENISNHYKRTLAQWAENLDAHSAEMEASSGEFFGLLRRYIMLALTTYRTERTLCYMIAAQKTPNDWVRRLPC